MPRECPTAFRNAPAVAGIDSAKRKSVRPPIAIAPKRTVSPLIFARDVCEYLLGTYANMQWSISTLLRSISRAEQIHVFKQSAAMDDSDIFEYHLRHYQIMVLYGQLDRLGRVDAPVGRVW